MGILHFSLFVGVTYRSPLSLRYFFSICSLEFSLGSHRCFPVCSLKSYVDFVFPSILFLLLLLRSRLPLWISFQPLPEAPHPARWTFLPSQGFPRIFPFPMWVSGTPLSLWEISSDFRVFKSFIFQPEHCRVVEIFPSHRSPLIPHPEFSPNFSDAPFVPGSL